MKERVVADESEHKLERHERNKPQGKRPLEGMKSTTRDSTAHLHNARVFSKAQNQ